MKKVIFSVDVEEWWSVHSFRKLNLDNNAGQLDDRMDVGINLILGLLEKYNSSGIFFILGRVAEKHPDIVGKISDLGHQVGTHGYAHRLIYNQTPETVSWFTIGAILFFFKIVNTKIWT